MFVSSAISVFIERLPMPCLYSCLSLINPQGRLAPGRRLYAKDLLRNSPLDCLAGVTSFIKYKRLLLNVLYSSPLFFFTHFLRYSHSQFVEINSHSLFSKWFSEVQLDPSHLKHYLRSMSEHMCLFYRVENWSRRCFRRFRSSLTIKMPWCLS